ncbi:MAG: rod shape-determining protein [Armatimonadetes bacterium]|nr:rod shape-determining protein [Armatimonadota bacterium]
MRKVLGAFSKSLGIDLGTANTLVYVQGKGIVLREPSVIAVDVETGKTKAVGEEAKRMVGKTPGRIVAQRPMRDGTIADYDTTLKMLSYFIHRVHRRSYMVYPRVVVGIPSGATEVERRAVIQAAMEAGATKAYVVEESFAAAIGAGLPVTEPIGSMVVDIGGGSTEAAVISLGGIVVANTIRVAGDEIDEAIANYVRRAYNLLIGERTAEEIKIQIGSAYPLERELQMEVRGRDLVSGLPKSIVLRSEEIREAISEPLTAIVDTVRLTLEQTPPELAADIMERGIILCGGGALLRSLDKLLQEKTGTPAYVADDPMTCVALGAGRLVENPEILSKALDGRSS